MRIPSSHEIADLRARYSKGTRVRLECMDDLQAPPIGTEGTVVYVDDLGSIHVAWDNGSSLAIAYGVDSCSIVRDSP